MSVSVIFIINKILYYIPKVEKELTEEFVQNPNLVTFRKLSDNYEKHHLFQQTSGNYLLAYDLRKDTGIKFPAINRIVIKKIIVNTMKDKVVVEHSGYPIRRLEIDPLEGCK